MPRYGRTAIDEIIDGLYGLPLAEFTGARNEAARELRKSGQREAAEQVNALRKPTAAAGAVNRLTREHRGEVEQFLRAADALRDAQFAGKGDLAATTEKLRKALEQLTGIGGEATRQTLLAAAVDDDAAQQLLEARLERELEPRGFGTLLAHAPSAPVRPRAATLPAKPSPPESKAEDGPAERPEVDDAPARALLRDAKAALSEAEAEERRAQRQWEQAQKEFEKAQASVDKTRAAVAEAQRDLDALGR